MAITTEFDEIRLRTSPRWIALALAALVGLCAALMLDAPSKAMLLAVLGVVVLAGLAWAIGLANREHYRVLFALALIDVAIQSAYMSHAVRGITHYGLVALFCLPLLPAAWSDRTRWRGGFRVYACYLGWAAVTIVYSLAPKYSAGRLINAVIILSVLNLLAYEVEDGDGAWCLLRQLVIAFGLMSAVVAASAVLLPRSLTWSVPETALPGNTIVRFSGVLGNPNDVGALMLLTVGTGACYWPHASRRWKFAIALIALASLATDVLADSRTPLIALAIGASAWAIWKYRARGFLILAGAGLLAAMAFVAFGNWRELVERGNVSTLTGRTDIWNYIINQIEARPLIGYGYEVGGAIYQSPYFPLWWGPWSHGAHSSLHDGYLDRAIGVGVPATLVWLYIVLRPWVSLFRRGDDDWGLKPVTLWVVLPLLIHNLAESSINDGIGAAGLTFVAVWALAERYRLLKIERERVARREAYTRLPPAIAALTASLAMLLCLALSPRPAGADDPGGAQQASVPVPHPSTKDIGASSGVLAVSSPGFRV